MVDTQGFHLVNISILELQDLHFVFCYFWLCTVVLSGGITPKLFWSIFVQDWFIKSNTTDDACGTGTAHLSGAHEFTTVFSGFRVARFVYYCLSFLCFFFWSLYCLSFDLRLLIRLALWYLRTFVVIFYCIFYIQDLHWLTVIQKCLFYLFPPYMTRKKLFPTNLE
jgi:hypothetical protein